MEDVGKFTERYPLNSKLVKQPDGKLKELVWRAGFDDVIPQGMYAAQLTAVIGHLEIGVRDQFLAGLSPISDCGLPSPNADHHPSGPVKCDGRFQIARG